MATVGRDPTADEGGIADPVVNAIVKIDGVEYTVVQVDLTGALAGLHLVRTTALRVTRPGVFRERT